MKKKVFIFTLLLAVFTVGVAYGEAGDLVLVNHDVDLEEAIEDVDIILEEIDNSYVDVDDAELDEAIEEVLNLEEEDLTHRIEEKYYRIQEKVENIAAIIEKQYNMKKQMVINTKEIAQLTKEVGADLKDLKLEMKDIVKDEDRTIDKEAYGEIRENIANLKDDVRKNDYIIGDIAKETRKYIRLVKNKQIRDAAKTFENILALQDEQIKLLKAIDKNAKELKTILEGV